MTVKVQNKFYKDLSNTAALLCDGDWVESKDQDESGSVRLIQLADIGDGTFINKSKRFMNIETAKKLNCTFLHKGDILIARMPEPVGRCCVFPFDEDEKYVTVVDIAILRVKTSYANSYIKHIINTPQVRHEISRQTTGTTRTRITRKKLEQLKIPLPPLPDQQKIAAILDAADSLRQKDRQLVEKYTALSKSLFLEMFGDPISNPMGWDTEFLGLVSKKITDGEHQNPPITQNGKYLVMAKDVLSDGVDFSNPKYVSIDNYKKYIKKCNPEFGDVLLVSRGATVGRCTVIKTEVPFCLMGSVILVKPSVSILGTYLIHLFKNQKFSKNLVNVSSASAQQAIYISHLKKLRVLLPPITLQNKFAEHIQLIEQQKQQAQASLERSEALFNSLLQRAFKGELTA